MSLDEEGQAAWQEWLKTRPQNVQDFAKAHPIEPGDMVNCDGEIIHFIGYGEYEDGRVGLIVTHIDPSVDYEAAVEARQQICPDHFEKAA